MAYILKLLQDQGFEREKDFFVNKNEMKILSNNPQFGSFIFKSMDDPDSIIGYQTYTAHVDEIDTMTTEKAKKAWNMILARTRQWPQGIDESKMQWNKTMDRYEPRNKVCAYTTPEGYRFTYETWGKEPAKNYKFMRVSSYENPFLPESYIENLEKQYSAELIKAYLEGEWTNLQSGNVYYAYNRDAHRSFEKIRKGETLFIGMDFNVRKMSSVVFVKRKGGQEWHAVAEINDAYDTPEMIEIIQERWQHKGHMIVCYPDSTGDHTHSTNASTSDIAQLRQAGFRVRANDTNPRVRNRVNAVNAAFSNARLYVDDINCPETARCLEQQAYNITSGKPDKTAGHDHKNDSFGYPIAFEMAIKPKLVPINYKFPIRQ